MYRSLVKGAAFETEWRQNLEIVQYHLLVAMPKIFFPNRRVDEFGQLMASEKETMVQEIDDDIRVTYGTPSTFKVKMKTISDVDFDKLREIGSTVILPRLSWNVIWSHSKNREG